MAFDFNEKDMIDSINRETDLDKYGVWVKKPPRDIEETTVLSEESSQENEQDTSVEEPLLQEAYQEPEISPIDDFESMAREETSDLSSLLELEESIENDVSVDMPQEKVSQPE